MKAVTPLLHQESLSHLISSYFFDLHNLFSRCGGGGGQGGPKNSLTKGSGPSNLVENVRGGLGDQPHWFSGIGGVLKAPRPSEPTGRGEMGQK